MYQVAKHKTVDDRVFSRSEALSYYAYTSAGAVLGAGLDDLVFGDKTVSSEILLEYASGALLVNIAGIFTYGLTGKSLVLPMYASLGAVGFKIIF